MIGIALVVLGIICIVRGRIPYGKTREVRGPVVYLVSLLLIVPALGFLIYGFKMGFDAAQNGKELDDKKLIELTLQVEFPTYLGIGLVCWLMLMASAQPVRDKRRYDDDEEDDDYDGRRRYDDDDRYERPQGRYEDDFDDRPRKRYETDRDDRTKRRRDDEHDNHDPYGNIK